MAARAVGDPDLFWHLRTGQQIVLTHSVPHQDLFSFTRYGQNWVAHEWLSEAIFFLIFHAFGWTGLMVLFAGVIAAAFLAVYTTCAGRPYIAGLVVALGALSTIPSWGVRPQMFTLLLAAIFLILLRRAELRQATQLRFLWWLLPLQLLWVNLHGGFLLGPALIALTLAGWSIDAWLGRQQWSEARGRILRLGLVLLACLVVIPLNPNGLEIYRYPFQTLQSRTMMEYIVEWASPNFHSADFKPFLGLLLLAWTMIAVSRKRLPSSHLLLLLATAYGSLTSSRHLPIFVLVAVPVIAERLQEVAAGARWLSSLNLPDRPLSPGKLMINALLVVLVAGFVGVRLHQVASTQPETEATRFPLAAIRFMAQQHPPAPIFNYYDWGGYLIAKLYPNYRVFIDGRADLYGDLMDKFSTTVRGQGRWRQPLQEYGIRTVIIPPDSGLAGLLRLDKNWHAAFEDKQAVIFVRN